MLYLNTVGGVGGALCLKSLLVRNADNKGDKFPPNSTLERRKTVAPNVTSEMKAEKTLALLLNICSCEHKWFWMKTQCIVC